MTGSDAAEYGRFLSRALTAYGARVGSSDPVDLPLMVDLHSRVEGIIRESVRSQLLRGESWSSIAEALGVPVSTAQSRWSSATYGKAMVVYGLKAEGSEEIRYVGKSKNLGLRLTQHRNKAAMLRDRIGVWLREIGAHNLEAVVLQEYRSEEDMAQGEVEWYDRLLAGGADLLNQNRPSPTQSVRRGPGGRPLVDPSVAAREKDARAAQRRADQEALELRQKAFDDKMEALRVARSAAWWEREIAAGRATVIG